MNHLSSHINVAYHIRIQVQMPQIDEDTFRVLGNHWVCSVDDLFLVDFIQFHELYDNHTQGQLVGISTCIYTDLRSSSLFEHAARYARVQNSVLRC